MAPTINASSSELLLYVKNGLRTAVAEGGHPWRLPVLITGNEGRVVVLRDVDEEYGSWSFFTDRRTPKVKQLETNNGEAAAVFYHPEDRSQVRLSGKATLSSEEELKLRWDGLQPSQKSSYAAFPKPGTALEKAGDGLSMTWAEGTPTAEEVRDAFANFAAFKVEISKMELLLLHRTGHRRCRWESWEGTNFKWLVP